jgi:hypothetical protein
MKRKFTLLTVFTMIFVNMVFITNAEPILKKVGNVNTDMATNEALTRVLSGIMGFLPWIQWIVTAGGLLMFAISVFNLYRGQQLDLAELFKNLIIYGIIIGGAWFGPKIVADMAGANDNTGHGIEINQMYIIE